MRTALPLLMLAVASPAAGQAFRATATPYYAFGDYREQAAALRFAGHGGGAEGSLSWRRLRLAGRFERLSYAPRVGGSGLAAFDATRTEAWLEYRAASWFSAAAGFRRFDSDPGDAAQEASSVILGLGADLALDSRTTVTGRVRYLAFSKFSGGGSAPFGIGLGLGVTSSPGPRRLRLAADFDFERLDRGTGPAGAKVSVPIQSATARLGLAILLGRQE